MYDENEDTVEPQEFDNPIEDIVDQQQADVPDADFDDQPDGRDQKMVPLSALKKVREKKRELELELQWERQRNAQASMPRTIETVDDNARYESATKEDLRHSQDEAVRAIEERLWIKQNPERFEEINEHLANFLKLKPHLAMAINQAPNRYEEAYELMSKLSPKQQQQIMTKAPAAAQAQKRAAPNAPGSVPKATGLNDAVDVMSMSDAEFATWRESKRKRR